MQIQSRPGSSRRRHTIIKFRHRLFRINMHHPSNLHLCLFQVLGNRRRRFHLCLVHRTNLLPAYITTIANTRP